MQIDKNCTFLGRILNRFSKDVGAIDEILPSTMILSIQTFAVMIGILVQVLIINWWLIFAVIVMFFLFGVIRGIYLPIAQTIKRLEGIGKLFPSFRQFETIFRIQNSYLLKFSAKSPVFSHVNSTLSGLTTIRSTGAQEMIRKQFDEHQDLHTSTYSLIIETGTAFGFLLDIVSIGFIAVVTYSFVALDDGKSLLQLSIMRL